MSIVKDKKTKKCHTDGRRMIDDLHTTIISKLNEDDKNEYFLDNGLFLDNYYRNDKLSNTKVNKGILNYFSEKEEKEEKEEEEDMDKEYIYSNNYYLSNIDDTTYKDYFKGELLENCKYCGRSMNLDDLSSVIICTDCGYTCKTLIVTEKNAFNDPPREVSYFTYKRINHFNEWLAQFQGKETTELPENIYKDILNEIKKDKHYNINKLTYTKVREILKKLNYNKYYENIPLIMNVICGDRSPKLNHDTEEKLRSLFKDIQIPFLNNCPANRRNFLSYSYVLHKFSELLELDDLIEYFPLLKSREKLQHQDMIWKKICHDLKWQFIPSV